MIFGIFLPLKNPDFLINPQYFESLYEHESNRNCSQAQGFVQVVKILSTFWNVSLSEKQAITCLS